MIKIEASNVKYAEEILADKPKQIKSAALAAINRTITHVKSKISITVRKQYVVSAKDIKDTIHIERAKSSYLQGTVSSKGRPLLLSAFSVSENQSKQHNKPLRVRRNQSKKRNNPLRVRVRRNGSLKPVHGLFSGTSRRGYRGLMLRTQPASYPLKVPYGPSVPQMLGNPDVVAKIESYAGRYLNDRFLHEVEHRSTHDIPSRRGKKK